MGHPNREYHHHESSTHGENVPIFRYKSPASVVATHLTTLCIASPWNESHQRTKNERNVKENESIDFPVPYVKRRHAPSPGYESLLYHTLQCQSPQSCHAQYLRPL